MSLHEEKKITKLANPNPSYRRLQIVQKKQTKIEIHVKNLEIELIPEKIN